MAAGRAGLRHRRQHAAGPAIEKPAISRAASSKAAHVVEATYSTHVHTHVWLETHGCGREWDGDKLTAWFSTQGVFTVREDLRSAARASAANVRVITQYMGGGFGSKFGAGAEGVIAAQLARLAGAPVKLMLAQGGASRHRQPAAAPRSRSSSASAPTAC